MLLCVQNKRTHVRIFVLLFVQDYAYTSMKSRCTLLIFFLVATMCVRIQICMYLFTYMVFVSQFDWDTLYAFIYFRRVHGKSFSSLTRMCIFELNMISSIFLTKTILKTRKEEIVSTWILWMCGLNHVSNKVMQQSKSVVVPIFLLKLLQFRFIIIYQIVTRLFRFIDIFS